MSKLFAHLKLIKTQQAGLIGYFHGNRWYGVIGEHFPQPSLWQALFPLMDPFKQHTNIRHILQHTCIGKPQLILNKEVISPECIIVDNLHEVFRTNREINIGSSLGEWGEKKRLKSCKSAFVVRKESMQLTFVDVQHEGVEVHSFFAAVLHVGVKQIHEHGLPRAWWESNGKKRDPESWYLSRAEKKNCKGFLLFGEKKITDVSVYVEAFRRWHRSRSTL